MVVVTHFSGVAETDLETALSALAARPGYLRGTAARSTDDAQDWVIITEWDTVGDYRRALGAYDVKLRATPVLARALDLPSAFESLVEVHADGTVSRQRSDLATDG